LKHGFLLLLPVMLSACAGIGGMVAGSAFSGAAMGSALAGNELRSPAVLCSTASTITVGYTIIGPDSQREQAMQLVAEHCGGEYIETKTFIRSYWYATDATCIEVDATAEPAPPCVYDETDPAGFGEAGTEG
jgi:hypothetical protein